MVELPHCGSATKNRKLAGFTKSLHRYAMFLAFQEQKVSPGKLSSGGFTSNRMGAEISAHLFTTVLAQHRVRNRFPVQRYGR
jgi:hypothetical protein